MSCSSKLMFFNWYQILTYKTLGSMSYVILVMKAATHSLVYICLLQQIWNINLRFTSAVELVSRRIPNWPMTDHLSKVSCEPQPKNRSSQQQLTRNRYITRCSTGLRKSDEPRLHCKVVNSKLKVAKLALQLHSSVYHVYVTPPEVIKGYGHGQGLSG